MQIDLTPFPDDPDLVAAVAGAITAMLAEPSAALDAAGHAAAWRVAAITTAHGGTAARGSRVRWATAERVRRGRGIQGTPWAVD